MIKEKLSVERSRINSIIFGLKYVCVLIWNGFWGWEFGILERSLRLGGGGGN